MDKRTPPARPPPPYSLRKSSYPPYDFQSFQQALSGLAQKASSMQNVGSTIQKAQNGSPSTQEQLLYPNIFSNHTPQRPCPNGPAASYRKSSYPYPEVPPPAYQGLPQQWGSQSSTNPPSQPNPSQQPSDQTDHPQTEVPTEPTSQRQPQTKNDSKEPPKDLMAEIKKGAQKAKDFLQKHNGTMGNSLQALRMAMQLAQIQQKRNQSQLARNNGRGIGGFVVPPVHHGSEEVDNGNDDNQEDRAPQQTQDLPAVSDQDQFLQFGQAGSDNNLQYEQLLNQMQNGIDSGAFDPQFLSYLQGSSPADLEQLMSQMQQNDGNRQLMNFGQNNPGYYGGMGDFSGMAGFGGFGDFNQMWGAGMGSGDLFGQFSGANYGYGAGFGGWDYGF